MIGNVFELNMKYPSGVKYDQFDLVYTSGFGNQVNADEFNKDTQVLGETCLRNAS